MKQTGKKMISIIFLFSGAKEQSRWFANSEAYKNIMPLFSQIVEKTGIIWKCINSDIRD